MRAQCCICADLFENSPSVNIAASPCGHTFHEACLLRWMDTSSTCPSCRTHIKKNQIIKRLFFDISEDFSEEQDVDKLVNQIGNLKAQLSEKDKQKQELAESRDHFAALLAACELAKDDLTIKLNEERNTRDVMQRDLKLLRKENSAYVEEMKEFRRTQRKLQELQNVETILKGCDSDIQELISQYSDGGESSVKHLASLVTVMKREYNQVLTDKKNMRGQVSKLKWSVGHYHSEAQRAKQEVLELKGELEKTNECLSRIEKENHENRRKVVHLRNALRHNKTEGSQSFHQAVNEDSPNVAYTPPKSQRLLTLGNGEEDEENLDTSPFKNACVTPDLFDDSPEGNRARKKRERFGEPDEPKLKFVKVPTAAERLQATVKRAKLDEAEDDGPKVPHAMFSIMQKKLTGQSNSRVHVPSVITRGYDGFGGSTTFVHPRGRSNVASSLKIASKHKIVKRMPRIDPKTLVNQPRLKECTQLFNSSSKTSVSSSSSLTSGNSEDDEVDKESRLKSSINFTKNKSNSFPNKLEHFFKKSSAVPSSSMSASSSDIPKLSSDTCGIIDLT